MILKKVRVKLKSKLYKVVVRPAIVHASECCALRNQEEQCLHFNINENAPNESRKEHDQQIYK